MTEPSWENMVAIMAQPAMPPATMVRMAKASPTRLHLEGFPESSLPVSGDWGPPLGLEESEPAGDNPEGTDAKGPAAASAQTASSETEREPVMRSAITRPLLESISAPAGADTARRAGVMAVPRSERSDPGARTEDGFPARKAGTELFMEEDGRMVREAAPDTRGEAAAKEFPATEMTTEKKRKKIFMKEMIERKREKNMGPRTPDGGVIGPRSLGPGGPGS